LQTAQLTHWLHYMYSKKDMEEAFGICELTIDDSDYPQVLREMADPPAKLYYRGDIKLLQTAMAAVVGTRKPTPYGVRTAKMLVAELARGATVVSGLAYGIDALAHETAVENGGKTIAVLGAGVEESGIYPSRHRGLANKIVAHGGLLISEYPPGSEPLKFHFPARNRIIAGLSEKLLVIEAGKVSGTLITAQLALDYNREVWAVPGPITSPLSYGTNWLIAQGAKPVLGVDDVRTVSDNAEQSQIWGNLDEREQIVCKLLAGEGRHINDLAVASGFDIPTLSGILTLLEMKGIVKNAGQGIFIRVK
jgi:DNA processing protein